MESEQLQQPVQEEQKVEEQPVVVENQPVAEVQPTSETVQENTSKKRTSRVTKQKSAPQQTKPPRQNAKKAQKQVSPVLPPAEEVKIQQQELTISQPAKQHQEREQSPPPEQIDTTVPPVENLPENLPVKRARTIQEIVQEHVQAKRQAIEAIPKEELLRQNKSLQEQLEQMQKNQFKEVSSKKQEQYRYQQALSWEQPTKDREHRLPTQQQHNLNTKQLFYKDPRDINPNIAVHPQNRQAKMILAFHNQQSQEPVSTKPQWVSNKGSYQNKYNDINGKLRLAQRNTPYMGNVQNDLFPNVVQEFRSRMPIRKGFNF